MASIMQGTTPSLTITTDPEDLLLSAVTAMELYIRNGNTTATYAMRDLDEYGNNTDTAQVKGTITGLGSITGA